MYQYKNKDTGAILTMDAKFDHEQWKPLGKSKSGDKSGDDGGAPAGADPASGDE